MDSDFDEIYLFAFDVGGSSYILKSIMHTYDFINNKSYDGKYF